MTRQLEKGEEPAFPRPEGPWSDRVQFAPNRPYAFRPNQIVCIGQDATAKTRAFLEKSELGGDVTDEIIFGQNSLLRGTKDFDVEEVVAAIRKLGLRTEPNYVFFLHGAGCGGCASNGCGCCGGAGLNPFTPNPFTPNPFTPNPFPPTPSPPTRSPPTV